MPQAGMSFANDSRKLYKSREQSVTFTPHLWAEEMEICVIAAHVGRVRWVAS